MNAFSKLIEYVNGSRHELKKVVWPSRREVTQHTIMVIVVSLAVAFFLGVLVDFSLTWLLEQIF